MKVLLCLFCGDLSITNLHVFLYFQKLLSVAIHFTTHLLQIFKDYNVLYFVKLYLLKTIYIFLWALLFIIPGIIKQLSYSQAEFIYKDYKELGKEITSNEAITLSREMMDGYKLDYFVLQLSFIGWYILEAFTFGLSALYSEPYANAAKAVFYRNISLKHFKNQGIIDDHAAGQTI